MCFYISVCLVCTASSGGSSYSSKNIKACADDVLSIGENVFCYDFAKTPFVRTIQTKPIKIGGMR